MKKIFICIICTIMCLCSLSLPGYAEENQDIDYGQLSDAEKNLLDQYMHDNPEFELDTIPLSITSETYYFDENGIMLKGITEIDGKKYFLGVTKGKVMRGLIYYDNKVYYTNPQTGELASNVTIVDGKPYFFGINTNRLMYGLINYNGDMYYSNSQGILQSGMVQVGKTWYYFDKNTYKAKSGWVEENGLKYYFDPVTKERAKGITTVDGVKYFFGITTGKMMYGWIHYGGYAYYTNPDTGVLITNKSIIDGVEYDFNSNGTLKPGWINKNGNTYYLNTTGETLTGWQRLAGIKYYFNSSGVLIGKNVKFVLDVSAHQGDIDWSTLWNSGQIDGVILRLGFGSDYTSQDDAKFLKNVKECERLGIPYGVYLYSYAVNTNDAISEANHALRLLKNTGNNFKMGVWFDMEDADGYKKRHGLDPYNSNNYNMLVSICATFVDRMSSNGYHSGVYASLSWFENQLKNSRLNNIEKWVAQWGNSCTYNGIYSIWQYSSNVQVPGISGRVDGNVYFK